MKKYKLLKDLPNKEKGSIAVFYNGDYKDCRNNIKPGQLLPEIGFYWDGIFTESNFVNFQCDLFPDWFEPVNEWPKSWDELDIGFWDFATEKHKKSALAFAKLSQLAKAINGDWVANWGDGNVNKYVIERVKNKLEIKFYSVTFNHISFYSKEAAEFSLEHHRKLWEQYYMM